MSKLKKQIITLICLIIGTSAAGVFASAAPVTSLTHDSVVESITEDAMSDAAATFPLMDAGSRLKVRRGMGRSLNRAFGMRAAGRSLERAFGMRAAGRSLDRAFGMRNGFADIVPFTRVAGASSAKRAAERAAGGRAVSVVKKDGQFVVTVISGGSARRCIVDAKSGQVLGCR